MLVVVSCVGPKRPPYPIRRCSDCDHHVCLGDCISLALPDRGQTRLDECGREGIFNVDTGGNRFNPSSYRPHLSLFHLADCKCFADMDFLCFNSESEFKILEDFEHVIQRQNCN